MHFSNHLSSPPSPEDHSAGPADSPTTLLEYGDYECPFSAQAHFLVKSIRESMNQSIRFIYRNFPALDPHPNALLASLAAEAAARQGRFWEMHHLLFLNQPLLRKDSLLGYAKTLHIDLERFVRDLASTQALEKIRADMRGAALSGVHGTPTFYINGWRYDGPVSQRAMLAALKAARDRPKEHSA